MTYKLGKDGWPTDETVVDMRDREIESLRQQLAETQEELRVCQQEAIGYREQLAESEAYIDSLFQQKIEIKQQLAECQARFQEPEGWKLVPIEPTSEMIAASAFDPVCATPSRRHIYKAMLSSAPKFRAKELE